MQYLGGGNYHPWGREAKQAQDQIVSGRVFLCIIGQRENSLGEGSSSGQKPRMLCLELDFSRQAPLLGFDAAAGRVSGTRTAALPGFVEIPACGVGPATPAKEGSSIFGLWAVWKLLQ